ncbi:MAG: family 31 glucosidase [Chitinivibrionales bacterium]|nr:family 31 glucosidase [Chitinivibrionales bacterium]
MNTMQQKYIYRNAAETIQIEAWVPDVVRIRASVNSFIADTDWALLAQQQADVTQTHQAHGDVIQCGMLEVCIDAGKRLAFSNNSKGTRLLEEYQFPGVDASSARRYRPVGGNLYESSICFKAQPDERCYGLGQHQHGLLDQKGCVIELRQRCMEVTIPFLVSNKGYALLWNNPGTGRVELAANHTRWIADGTRQFDFVVIAYTDYFDCMRKYADITGHTPLLPEWAAGLWQSKLRYSTQQEMLEVAHEYHRRGLPLSVLVCDYFHWPHMGDFRFDEQQWPDPQAMARELESLGAKTMVSTWPAFNRNSIHFDELRSNGYLLQADNGSNAFMEFIDPDNEGMQHFYYYDPSQPEARAFVWDKVRQGYYTNGIKLFWLDGCEPAIDPYQQENARYAVGSGKEVACMYPMFNAQTFHDGLKAEGEGDVVLLSRSAWAGIQRYGVVLWSGDILSNWEALQIQVRAGLNTAMSGIPWWTTDIGGFAGGDIDDPDFQELIVRWFEYGCFCPIFRLHGCRKSDASSTEVYKSGAANEVWSFGTQAYEILASCIHLRERIKPYIMQQMQRAHELGTPPMRPLFFDFPGDEKSYVVDDAFMFGPDLLVAPVVQPQTQERNVYLPEGADWKNAWTDETFEGGASIPVEAPLEQIPLFLRANTILPITP